jgi:hypothetical protein
MDGYPSSSNAFSRYPESGTSRVTSQVERLKDAARRPHAVCDHGPGHGAS